MDDVTKARWQKVVDRFGLNKTGAAPWHANALAANFEGAAHGEKCSIQFLLNVWDPTRDWPCGKFDLVEAFRTWDDTQRQAFLAWANDPLFP